MKKILISLMAIALVIGLVGAGSFAYFSDTETSTGNTFTAGTLDLTLSVWTYGRDTGANILPATSTTDATFAFTNVAPGESGDVSITLTNAGSIIANDASIKIDLTDSVGGFSNRIQITKLIFDTANILSKVEEVYGGNDGTLWLNDLNGDIVDVEELYEAVTGGTWSLSSGGTTNLVMTLELNGPNTGNAYQNAYSTIDFTFNLYQVEQE